MPKLLRIDSTARLTCSHSSDLADQADTAWLRENTDGTVIHRHLGQKPIPVISQETISGFHIYLKRTWPTLCVRRPTCLTA